MNNEMWNDTPMQAVRLVGEIMATLELSPEDWKQVADSMNIDVSLLKALADRISDAWEAEKAAFVSKESIWIKYPDEDLGCVYECPEGCGECCIVSPGWHQENGTPMCPECDVDMEYQYTRVRKGRLKLERK